MPFPLHVGHRSLYVRPLDVIFIANSVTGTRDCRSTTSWAWGSRIVYRLPSECIYIHFTCLIFYTL